MGILLAAEPKSVFVFRQISARGTRTHRTSDRLGDPEFVCRGLWARAVVLTRAPGLVLAVSTGPNRSRVPGRVTGEGRPRARPSSIPRLRAVAAQVPRNR